MSLPMNFCKKIDTFLELQSNVFPNSKVTLLHIFISPKLVQPKVLPVLSYARITLKWEACSCAIAQCAISFTWLSASS